MPVVFVSCCSDLSTSILDPSDEPMGRRNDMSSFDTIETRVLSKGELGQVVRYLREIRQWSQETLAELS